jgi:hypothetical protein
MHTRRTLSAVSILLALAGFATAARADLTATATPSDSYGNTNGGEFLFTYDGLGFDPVTLSVTGEFQTFCVEKNEYLHFGDTYYVNTSDAAVHGGAGGGDPDPLDPQTAYLYAQFITGQLANYTYGVVDGGVSRAVSADALQHVIWYIEQEESQAWVSADNSLMDQFYQDAVDHAGTDIGNVRVLNMWNDAAGTMPAQDELVMVPEPSGAALAALGATLLAWRRRRG